MIICSLPRCGATKYCLDLEEKTGLKFIGEFNPIYIDVYGDTVKQQHHETGFQPNYTVSEYNDILVNPAKYIVLVNQSPHLLIDRCDTVLLRRNMKDAFLSQANFFIKCRPYLKGEGVLQHLYISYQSFIGVVAYLSQNVKPIVWYEDYFGMYGTKVDCIENHQHGKIIMKHTDAMFGNEQVNSLFERVKENASI